MSGSSGSFGHGSGGKIQSCDKIVIRTQLASPVAAVLRKIKKNDYLDIELASPAGPLQAFTQTRPKEMAGAILTTDPALLINCITQGYRYQAKVLEDIVGGDCRILITNIP